MRFALWLCGLLLLQVSAAHAEVAAESFNHHTAAAITGLIGGTGLSESGLELDTVSGDVNFDKQLLSTDDELLLSTDDGNPSEAVHDATNINDVPEPTTFILAGIFVASYVIGRKLRVKSV